MRTPRDDLYSSVEKRFLCDDADEFGSVCYNVSIYRFCHPDDEDKPPYDMESSLRIQDCYRSITLDFCTDEYRDITVHNRIDKLDTLISTLQQMRADIVEANRRIEINKAVDRNTSNDG